ncbi:MAG: hypothetical protein H6825_04770 [Planctomycetes bacterium]|nr:hypothetical protein [Planctomycetota bacterium]
MNRTITLTAVLLVPALAPATLAGDVCVKTAKLQKKAAAFELNDEYKTALAICANLDDPAEHDDCLAAAKDDYLEGRALVKEQYAARLDLCSKLGGGSYDPAIDPADFTSEIDNPLFPLPVGAHWTYESVTDEGTELIEVEALDETRVILGVACRAVRDTVTLDGDFVEDTLDWYAQDASGNVWYFGELSFSYEDGFVADLEGSWIAGVDGAKPGIVMFAAPAIDTTYRQEWLPGDAEDAATVLALDGSITVAVGTFEDCVVTEEFTPLEPEVLENKFYVAGIGLLAETSPEGEFVELVSYSGL